MEKKEETYFTVGELADKAGVTVRTLQYYDKTGLLKSSISKSGRRIYTRDDIFKLQQILFLKSFGFSLKEIKDKILKNKSFASLEKVFSKQREIILGQVENMNRIAGLLDMIISEVKADGDVSLDKLTTIMNLMDKGNPYSFIIRYFGDEQLKNIAERFDSQEEYTHTMNNAEELFPKLNALYHQGADPAGIEGQDLAEKWWNMVSEFTGGDENLLKPLISAGLDTNNWPEEAKVFQDAIEHFLGKAMEIYLKNKGVNLKEMGESHE
ncbi:MAG: MerR family transcriptional regulator [Clostridiaceae bacterium]